MEQRRLRLGDILDDYCPRERRVTNHAVVAMVEEDVKQTRCTTCDTEHVYKGAKAPRRKKAETTGRLYKQVLAGLTDPETAAASANGELMNDTDQMHDSIEASMDGDGSLADEPIDVVAEVVAAPASSHDAADPVDPVDSLDALDPLDDDSDDQPPMLDEGPVHRPLIRAQLPRVEGLKLERQAPEFTIRQNAGRGNGHFRGGGGGSNNNNGQRFGRGPRGGGGGGGGRGGAGQGFGRGQGGNQPRHGGGPRKRGR